MNSSEQVNQTGFIWIKRSNVNAAIWLAELLIYTISYLTTIPGAHIGYEMVDSQQGA